MLRECSRVIFTDWWWWNEIGIGKHIPYWGLFACEWCLVNFVVTYRVAVTIRVHESRWYDTLMLASLLLHIISWMFTCSSRWKQLKWWDRSGGGGEIGEFDWVLSQMHFYWNVRCNSVAMVSRYHRNHWTFIHSSAFDWNRTHHILCVCACVCVHWIVSDIFSSVR